MNRNPTAKTRVSVESPTLPLPPPEELRRAATERLLGTLNTDEIALLADRLKTDPGLPTGAVQEHSSMGARGEPPSHIAPITGEDIARNNRGLKSLSPNLYDVEKFLPELRKEKPERLLHILSERFRENPTPVNGALLQHVVNRITSSGPVDHHTKGEITKAITVLHQPSETNPGKADDIFYWAYVDANFGGASIFGDLVPGWIYWAQPYVGDAMNDKISSLSLSCTSNEVGGNVILFENAGFVGRYLNFALTVPENIAGLEYIDEDVSFVGDAFNDITSSILIVRRFANATTPVQIGALVPQSKITDIVNNQSGVSSAGAVTFTWDMWPTGPTSSSDWHPNDPAKTFIDVIVPINVPLQINPFGLGNINLGSVDTYSAQVRYWIYIYADSQGNLQGYVDWYGCWVQGGLFTGQVQNGLMQKIPGTIGQVNNLVSNALALANVGGPYRFTYFLPGTNAVTGSTWDDVSVVAVP